MMTYTPTQTATLFWCVCACVCICGHAVYFLADSQRKNESQIRGHGRGAVSRGPVQGLDFLCFLSIFLLTYNNNVLFSLQRTIDRCQCPRHPKDRPTTSPTQWPRRSEFCCGDRCEFFLRIFPRIKVAVACGFSIVAGVEQREERIF